MRRRAHRPGGLAGEGFQSTPARDGRRRCRLPHRVQTSEPFQRSELDGATRAENGLPGPPELPAANLPLLWRPLSPFVDGVFIVRVLSCAFCTDSQPESRKPRSAQRCANARCMRVTFKHRPQRPVLQPSQATFAGQRRESSPTLQPSGPSRRAVRFCRFRGLCGRLRQGCPRPGATTGFETRSTPRTVRIESEPWHHLDPKDQQQNRQPITSGRQFLGSQPGVSNTAPTSFRSPREETL